jgi:hypothetical protein
MEQNTTTREWLGWLIRSGTEFSDPGSRPVWPQYIGFRMNHAFLPLLLIWVTVGVLHISLVRWMPGATWQGGLQVASDVIIISACLHHRPPESYFISLYLRSSSSPAYFHAAWRLSLRVCLSIRRDDYAGICRKIRTLPACARPTDSGSGFSAIYSVSLLLLTWPAFWRNLSAAKSNSEPKVLNSRIYGRHHPFCAAD